MSKLLISAIALTSIAAAPEKTTLGTRKNPIKFVMVPSSDAGKILDSMKPVAKCLEKETGLVFDVSVPNNYIVN